MPGHLDWKRGRFTADYETDSINDGLRGWQAMAVGDEVAWYRFDSALSTESNIYDESSGGGRVYDGPFMIPVLHATHHEGGDENTDTGYYFNDTLHFTATFDQIRRAGIVDLDLQTRNYGLDRVVYDNKVFRVMTIEVLGQIQERDIIAGVDAVQVKPDELVDDAQFAQWSQDPEPTVVNGYPIGDR